MEFAGASGLFFWIFFVFFCCRSNETEKKYGVVLSQSCCMMLYVIMYIYTFSKLLYVCVYRSIFTGMDGLKCSSMDTR